MTDQAIGRELAVDRDRSASQHSVEDNREILRDTRDAASAKLSRKRQRRKLSVDEPSRMAECSSARSLVESLPLLEKI